MESNKSVFLRPVSGLVKSAGIFDVFIYNVGLISIGIGVAYTHLYGAANYPGGDIPIASLIATGIMVFVGLGMWCWTVTLPRSGGIYVFVSRGLSAPLGFALSFVESCCWLFYNAVGAVLISTVGLAPLFATIASISKSESMMKLALSMQTANAQFIVGSILIILSGLLLISGMRKFFLVQKIMFFIAVIGTVVMIVALIVFTKEQFVANFNELMNHLGNNAHDTIIDKAKSGGWSSNRFDMWQTLRLSVWPFLPLIGGAFSIAIGGEVRQVEKGQGFGIIGAIVFCGLLFALIGYLSYQTVGYEFQGAITYNSFNQPEFSTTTQPYFTLLMGILTKNIYITVIIAISFIAWIYFWIPGMLAYAERAMLAWSFDRLAPEKIGHVSDKYHTPTVAIIISVLVSVLFTALYVYTSFFATLIFILAASIAWFITMITGVIFPYRNKEIYEKSPIAKYKIFNIPLMSIVCSIAAIGLLVIVVLLWNDPVAAGHDAKSLIIIGGVFIIGLILYFLMKRKRKKEGIDINLAFKQIPIE